MKKIFLIFMLLLADKLYAQTPAAEFKSKYPEGYIAKIDEVYETIGDWKGREDIYFNPKAEKPTAVVFNIHGGAWSHGVKESQTGFGTFFKLGYAVANIEYRMTNDATAPAAIEDVRAAILYVVQHAKELNIDPDRIVVMGSSAGAHLALMAGLLQNDNKFDGNYKNVQHYTIKAIIDKYGPTDFNVQGFSSFKSLVKWLGVNAESARFRESVSPVYYVKKTSPPVFIVHGYADPIVPYEQSVSLKNKLDEMGVKNRFLTMPGGGHGKFTAEQKSELSKAIIDFLKEIQP